MHIYHYAAYEKSALLRLAGRYGVAEMRDGKVVVFPAVSVTVLIVPMTSAQPIPRMMARPVVVAIAVETTFAAEPLAERFHRERGDAMRRMIWPEPAKPLNA